MITIKKEQVIWALLRINLGLIFLWAFFDKLFGWGFATARNQAWILGNSPTAGFLAFGTRGPFAAIYQGIAGNAFIDWIFMLGLLGIGLALVLGMGVKVAGYAGALMMLLIWTALLPPEHHPFLDDHLIYGIVLIGLTFVKSGHWWGFGDQWSRTKLVRKHKWLE